MILTEFTVYGLPAQSGSKTPIPYHKPDGSLGVRTFDASKRMKPWKNQVSWAACKVYKRPVFRNAVRLEIIFYLPRPKNQFKIRKGATSGILKDWAPPYPIVTPDLTKLVRCLEDALKGIIWKDDSQVVEQETRKLYGEVPRAEVKILGIE